jgi:hypothetical protein
MKVVTIVMHKIQPENAWEQRVLTQLGFPQVKKPLRRPQFLVRDSELKRLIRILADQDSIRPTEDIVREFENGHKIKGKVSSKQAVELCTK